MNGATTDPLASTSRPPSTTVMTMIGRSQNLRRTTMKRHIWVTYSIAVSSRVLEQILEAVLGRTGRVAAQPVALRRRVPGPLHRVPAEAAHHVAHRREHAEEHDSHHQRA